MRARARSPAFLIISSYFVFLCLSLCIPPASRSDRAYACRFASHVHRASARPDVVDGLAFPLPFLASTTSSRCVTLSP